MIPSQPLTRWRALHQVKAGNAAAEYEDAFAADPSRRRFAVADGASEAAFADTWARLLVEGFVVARHPWRDLDWLAAPRRAWAAATQGRALPWYVEAKREEGAFATLLGLALRAARPERPAAWRALAVGDCCLFHCRGRRLLRSFPVTRSADFGNRPQLLGSHPGVEEVPKRAGGRFRPGDRFLLMSDAVAQWMLHQHEHDGQPLADLAALLAESDPPAALPGWLEERRAHGLRNDDVTVLVVDV